MRALLLVVIIGIIAVIAAVSTGFLNISQTRTAEPPQVTATKNGITAKGGQAPAFDVETGSVKIGSSEAQVKVPKLEVQKPQGNQAAAATGNAQ